LQPALSGALFCFFPIGKTKKAGTEGGLAAQNLKKKLI